MPRGPNRRLALVAVGLVALLGLGRPVGAELRADRSTDPADALAANAHVSPTPAQLDFFATAGTWFTTEFDTRDFDVERFEASLPRTLPMPAEHDPEPATLAAARPDERKPQSRSAADQPRNKTPAAKQPLRSGTTSGKTNGTATRTPVPVGRGVAAAAPPATTTRNRPRAARPDHGPRELFIARVPPSDRDEAIPAQKVIPVIRAPLPPPAPALALK